MQYKNDHLWFRVRQLEKKTEQQGVELMELRTEAEQSGALLHREEQGAEVSIINLINIALEFGPG